MEEENSGEDKLRNSGEEEKWTRGEEGNVAEEVKEKEEKGRMTRRQQRKVDF
jgi:hypothetical protein